MPEVLNRVAVWTLRWGCEQWNIVVLQKFMSCLGHMAWSIVLLEHAIWQSLPEKRK